LIFRDQIDRLAAEVVNITKKSLKISLLRAIGTGVIEGLLGPGQLI